MLSYHPKVVIAASVGTGDQDWRLVSACNSVPIDVETLLLISLLHRFQLNHTSFASVQVQTALYSFDALKVPADIQKVNCSSKAYDKQLFDHIFVADAVEHMLE